MAKFGIVSFTLVCSLLLFQYNLLAQDTLKNKKDGHYYFTVDKALDKTAIQDQSRTGTCWSFSALSFMESELIRMGKGEHKLSEMFIVRMAYIDKAENYVRMHGLTNFGQGGAFHDIPHVIEKYGILPQELYQGLDYGTEKHNHSEMEAVLKGILDAVIANKQRELTTSWMKAYTAVLDAYLGPLPENFEYQGKTYKDAKEFSNYLGLNMDDYVVISSFTHHSFYDEFVLEVPDNWLMEEVYNVPLEVMMSIATGAIGKGFTVAWAADVSEKGFSFRDGLAIVPVNEDAVQVKGKDNQHFNDAGAEKSADQFDTPGPEKEITQDMRQDAFDNYQTTDDHGMHFVGIVHDQNGNQYFIVKNSWGTANDCDGYFYASMPYVAYKTINIMVHKDALPKELRKKIEND